MFIKDKGLKDKDVLADETTLSVVRKYFQSGFGEDNPPRNSSTKWIEKSKKNKSEILFRIAISIGQKEGRDAIKCEFPECLNDVL